MLDIVWSAKIGDHDIVDILESENIASEFDTPPVMVCDAFDSKRTIADTDSFATTEDKCLFS